MIYRAYLDGVIFFDSSADYDGLTLTEAEVELEAGGAGSFTFSIPPQNIAYGSFNMLTSIVSVYRDDEEIFYGRVYSISGEFNTVQTVECEGYLAALNDSIVEPFTFNSTISALVLQFIELHNERCPGYPFELGTVTVDDDYVYRAYENYETAWSRLSDLVDSYGGYMSARHSTDEDGNECVFLDWYQEYETEASQSIDFGENLIDLTQESDASEIITCLIPFGAEVTEEDDDGNETTYQVDITSVTDDGRDYVYSEDGIAQYGYIWGTEEWEDVTEPSNLLNKAQEYVNSAAQGTVTIKATAVDLANIDEDISHFTIGENIQVTSSPHGIDQTFLCTELKFDLLDPSKDELTLGDEIVGYVTAASKNLKSSLKVVETTVNSYTLNEINEAVDQITTLLQSTYITQDSEAITALAEEIDALNEQIQSLASITLAKAAISPYYNNPYVTLTVTESSTSATANTSTLSYSLVLYRPSSVTSSSSKSYTITINGTAHSGTTTIGGSGTKTITSGTQTVSHSSDGTKSITIKLSFTFGLTWSGTSMGTYSGSTTMTLTSLDRTAPTITISSTSVTNSTIYFAATSNVSCNTWQYSTNGGSSYTTFNSGSATSVTKTISGLSANTTYSLRVRAYKVANNISSYASKSVTTLGASSITSASSVTMSDDGTACAVKFTPYSTAYYFTVGFSLGDMTWTSDRFCPASTSAYTYTDYSFITSEWAPYITSAASGTCTATLTTYASSSTSTVMGTSTKTFTLTVPSSCTPTVDTFTVSEAASSFPDAFTGAYVLGLSELEFSATASGIYGSTISAITYTLGSDTYEGEADDDTYTATTDALAISGDYTVTATATDSRGYTATATEDITIYEYSSPTVSGLTFDISGTSCKVTATGACSSVNGLNTAYITFTAVCVSDVSNTQTATYTKTVDEDEWTSAGAYSFSHTFTLDTVQTETYKITFEIEDETGTTASLSKQTGVICFSRLAGGKGAAFFKEADAEGLEVAGDTTLDGTLTVAGYRWELGSGTLSCNNSSYYSTTSVTFDTSFSDTPYVFMTIRHDSSGKYHCKLLTKSTTGFSLSIWSSSSSGGTVSYDWMAIGYA